VAEFESEGWLMCNRNETNLARGIVAGIAGGLVASWIMNEFMANIGPSLQQAVGGEKSEKQSRARRMRKNRMTRR
jgi:hypothetical protein